MSTSGKRLRISLIIAIAAVSANAYSVVSGAAQGFYADLSTAPVMTGYDVAPSDSFAAFEPRAGGQPGTD